ncbi:hypothetical protein F5Y03DRAFT_129415 [Xylaria venustula]|nr:hypothetical protein F5Y03DRAFT_129415 [Xylaria venustula]
MAAPVGLVTETLVDITITTSLSPEPELQRGRKRRRDFLFEAGARPTMPSSESATFRGRCRYRSSSRYLDMSRPTSQQHAVLAVSSSNGNSNRQRNVSASPSPSRRKMIRITQLAGDHRHPRSSSPSRSRSRSPYAVFGTSLLVPRRRRHTRSRSRARTGRPVGFETTSRSDDVKVTAVEALVLPVTTYEVVASGASEGYGAKNRELHDE